MSEYTDDFAKLIIELENIDVVVADEDHTLHILNALPSSYAHFVEAMRCTKDSLSLEVVLSALRSKMIEFLGEGLDVKSKSKKNKDKAKTTPVPNGQPHPNGNQTKELKKLKCFQCHKECHFKRDCPELKNKKKAAKATLVEEAYDTSEHLNVFEKGTRVGAVWILDCGCTYHMSPNKSWFEQFKPGEGGKVLLGNNNSCKVLGMGTVRIKAHIGKELILT